MTRQSKQFDFSFYLGIVRSPEHSQQLQEIAHWLDQNKFSCTYSEIEGRAIFQTCPHDPEQWTRAGMYSKDGFVLYATEHIIHSLSRALGECDDS